jgi:RNA polymerase sigma-70 factor (ECF subfamily)
MKEFTRNVLPYVPAFRRFASGHAADIGSADALVMIALKTLKARWMFLGFVGLKIEGYGLIHSLADDKAAIFDDADGEPIPEYDTGIACALRRLTTLDRSMILLTSVEQLTFQEVGSALGIPDSFVINELPLARERLREVVEIPLRTSARRGAHLRSIK